MLPLDYSFPSRRLGRARRPTFKPMRKMPMQRETRPPRMTNTDLAKLHACLDKVLANLNGSAEPADSDRRALLRLDLDAAGHAASQAKATAAADHDRP